MLEVGCGERGDGTWAALEVAVIVPRQNGKNEILAARELAGVVLFKDDLITHSAHRADTTLEQFRKLEQLADDYPDFGRLVMRVSRVNGMSRSSCGVGGGSGSCPANATLAVGSRGRWWCWTRRSIWTRRRSGR